MSTPWIDNEYYTDTYPSQTPIPAGPEFDNLEEISQHNINYYTHDVIRVLIGTDTIDTTTKLSTHERTMIKNAVCAQIEYIKTQGAFDMEASTDSGGFSLGKFNISNTSPTKNRKSLNENKMSQRALDYLHRTRYGSQVIGGKYGGNTIV